MLTAPTALAHEGHPPAVTSAHWAPAVLRCVVLVASAAVCGVGLLRPVAGQPSRLTRGVTLVAGLLAAVVLLVSMAVTGAAPGLSMAQAVLTVLVPLLLAHELVAVTALVLTGLISYEACAGHAGTELAAGVLHVAAGSVWLGAVVLLATAGRDVCEPGATHGRSWLSRRLTPWALAAAALVAVTGISQAWADGLRPDAVTVGSTFGQVVTLKALLFLVVGATGIAMSRRQAWRLAPVEANGLTAALAAGALLAAIPAPPLPGVPSVALLRTVTLSGAPLPMTVVPQRPGWNLVHAAGPPGSTVAVGLDRAHLTRMAPRPGTTGGWALVHLPPGHSTLWVERGGAVDALRLNTADGQRDPRITGPDGPECASAALGALLANPAAAPGRCPADALSTADGVALRELVGFLARRHVRALDLVGDGSPRSAQASAAVRAAAVASGVAIGPGRDPNLPRIVVGGWPTAELVLQESARGAPQAVYLAPWLATAALLAHSTGAVVALGFDPREAPPHDYLAALRAAVPGESCTPAGYTAWLAARGMVSSAPTRLYASARISLLPAELDHHHSDTASWVPGGALIPVTAPLAP
ncbi:MAG TPA: hypothetical protein VFO16_20640 [Pseudonocardiaceae bacterium]|nr:hypothetical protein [Pseudonocardiaceae bacterium]